MKSSFHRPLTALFVASVLIVGKDAVAIAQDNSAPPSMHSMDQWAADHAALLDAELAGLKAGLKLTPDQEMLWAGNRGPRSCKDADGTHGRHDGAHGQDALHGHGSGHELG